MNRVIRLVLPPSLGGGGETMDGWKKRQDVVVVVAVTGVGGGDSSILLTHWPPSLSSVIGDPSVDQQTINSGPLLLLAHRRWIDWGL
jgi:hypothetical protein